MRGRQLSTPPHPPSFKYLYKYLYIRDKLDHRGIERGDVGCICIAEKITKTVLDVEAST